MRVTFEHFKVSSIMLQESCDSKETNQLCCIKRDELLIAKNTSNYVQMQAQ
eukprot:m.241050 g.241050  ORF g.241050 m.241050 type:complete len:51 (+) comp16085_c0_seq11:3268-3420(+)